MRELIEKKYYRIWAVSSLNYANHFERSIYYDFKLKKLIYPSRVGEFPLIPVVWGDIEFEEDNSFFNNHILTKVRILQFLSQNAPKSLTFSQIVNTISEIFQKDQEKVDILLRASILQRLVDFDMKQNVLTSLPNSKLRLTDLGKAIIEKWIYLPAYNEYTMHLAAVPKNLLNEFPRFYPERKNGPLAGNEQFEYLMTPDYIARLFPTFAKWIALVAAIEFWEETRYNFYFKSGSNNTMADGIRFSFIKIADKLRKNIEKIINKILDNEKHLTQSAILKTLYEKYEIENP
jgi:hypothetical protein